MPRLRLSSGQRLRVQLLPEVRVGKMRVREGAHAVRWPEAAESKIVSPTTGPGWTVLDERRRGTRFVRLPIKSILNSPQQTGMGFWSLNPYVGCEFGCTYCYARYAHRYVVERARGRGELGAAEWSDDAFERQVFVKSEAPDVVALTLNPARVGDHAIVIGTATDPYQPAERRFKITRRILERLAQFHGLKVGLITKSPLVARDVDVLRRLAERGRLTVIISLIAVDALLVRKLEVRTPMPAVRLKALEQLVRAGLHAGVMLAPVLPGITDDVGHLGALMRAAKDAGAAFVRPEPLRLYPPIRARFLPVIAREFPALLPKYERAFDAAGFIAPAYAAALERRVARLQRELGFPVGDARTNRRTKGTQEAVQWEIPL
ncbi:MAG: radical SAM protein [Gemmatimonadetes bacterium]|nr:radical SAM protein [Gemmatimonadota bacterium]